MAVAEQNSSAVRRQTWLRPGAVFILLAAFLLIALSACAAAPNPVTYDGPQSPEARKTGPNSYQIYAFGNRSNSRKQVEAYGLVKAAETTIEHGHDYFKIVDSNLKATQLCYGYSGCRSIDHNLLLDIETYPAEDVPEDKYEFYNAAVIAATLGQAVRRVGQPLPETPAISTEDTSPETEREQTPETEEDI